MTNRVLKHSYTVPCASTFRDAVDALAARRKVNVGDLARSILLVVPDETVAAYADPGEPPTDDRETVVLKSGPAEGRPWRRKPRLQVRMPPGHDIPFIRKALALALAMDKGDVEVSFAASGANDVLAEPPPEDNSSRLVEINEELDRLRTIVSVLAFDPLPDGIRNRGDALHVLGFPPSSDPDSRTVRAKFRMLATIHHPDSHYGSHQRMSQLNQAMEFLRRYVA
ncbi:J domain-containing protein [Telmatospirillum sp.]|uniref:J domain-containing protein n=1 Tax=Telmatospirillum sp. TaxID=2079197 RepID=UPI00284B3EF4|nr:J domain-containing protein [Telmatospirillum sp.]MDR3440459.1 J domain-containing protein [Telmatospirillum sp.]